MTIPSYAAAGTGVTATLGASASVGYPASISAGHTLWCHTLALVSLTGYDDSALLAAGFTLVGDVTFSTTNRSRVYTKVATGSESGTVAIVSPALGTVKCRMYRTIDSISNAQYWSTAYTLTGTDASIEMPDVPVRGQAAAFAFVAVADDNALASATGETGGDWTEAVAEYADATGDDGALQLQTSSLVAGPLSGGSQTMAASDPWCVIAFAVRNARQVKIGTDTESSADSTYTHNISNHTLLASQFGDTRNIVVAVGTEGTTPPTACSVTYGGNACTQVNLDSVNNNSGSLHYIDEDDLPADGARTPAISHTGGSGASAVGGRCMQFEGMKQGGPDGFDHDTQSSATTVTNTVTPAVANDFILSVIAKASATVSMTHSDNQDEISETVYGTSVMITGVTMLNALGSETSYSTTVGANQSLIKISAWWGVAVATVSVSVADTIAAFTDAVTADYVPVHPTTVADNIAAFTDAVTADYVPVHPTTVADNIAAFTDAVTADYVPVHPTTVADNIAAFTDAVSADVEFAKGGRLAFVWTDRLV